VAAMRVPGKGRIDNNRAVSFSLDGVQYLGFGGDPLASAWIGNVVRLRGRSFKYH